MRLRRQLEALSLKWAESRGIALRAGVEGHLIGQVANLDDNFFRPLDSSTRREFLEGAGGELNPPEGNMGHLFSLGSSSALCVNFFQPWRDKPLAPLLRALGLPEGGQYKWEFDPRLRMSRMRVETPPVDLLLHSRNADAPAIAFETKFCEPYDGKPRRGLPDFYVSRTELFGGWPHLQRMARELNAGQDQRRAYLHAAQTIRQLLALRKNFGQRGFVLFHLWYDVRGPSGMAYRAELEEFAARVRGERIAFAPLSWQELYRRIVPECAEERAGWLSYLQDRYRLHEEVRER